MTRKHAFALTLVGLAAVLLGWFGYLAYRSGSETSEPAKLGVTELPTDTKGDFTVPDGLPTTEAGWKERLSDEQYRILREKGTEIPFTSPLNDEKRPGTYYSADCGQPLFRSEQKYDSGTGWPSFWAPIDKEQLIFEEDRTPGLGVRIEVLTKCGGHLGHVFNDGPEPTGLRYCMNGDALIFVPDDNLGKR